jgi:hypothetical protein
MLANQRSPASNRNEADQRWSMIVLPMGHRTTFTIHFHKKVDRDEQEKFSVLGSLWSVCPAINDGSNRSKPHK